MKDTATTVGVYEMYWRPIESAPKEGRLDLWAKRWIARDDSFEWKRFTDCFWRSTHFSNLPKEWHATHWMPAPEPPQEAS